MDVNPSPVKNKIIWKTAIAALIVFMISCSDTSNSSIDGSLIKVSEKKLTKAKKKERKKSITFHKKTKISAPASVSKKMETPPPAAENAAMTILYASKINKYAAQHGYSIKYCFLVDMSLPSGRNRFFVYDLEKKLVVYSGLVAHGSCNQTFLSQPKFSNAPKYGCTSLGKYKVGEFYRGQYGKSFRLYGLDKCNSNAYKRAVVIHGYDCVPDKEIYPRVLCNSLGCVMVSNNFFDRLSHIIEKSEKPIVLWVYG